MRFPLRSDNICSTTAAKTYTDWSEAARLHDQTSGMEDWRGADSTRLYDYSAIRERLYQLRALRSSKDNHGLLYALNEGVHGNMCGIGNAELYNRSKFGTKHLIEQYIEEIDDSLIYLDGIQDERVPETEKLDFFIRAQRCYGHTALSLSGGGVYGNFHVGVLKALIEQDLLPTTISGSSAGSMMAAIVATHPKDELEQYFDPSSLQIGPQYQRRSISQKLKEFIPKFELSELIEHFERVIPDLTFQEAYELTGINLNISISPAELNQPSRLMNAVTSPNVHVRSAVMASCAVPGIYPPVELTAKTEDGKTQSYLPGHLWVDGSLSSDIPSRRLSRLYGCNNFIVSQVNPFAMAALADQAKKTTLARDVFEMWHHSSKIFMTWAEKAVERYGKHRPVLRYSVNSLASVWLQEYEGNINIVPPLGFVRPWKSLGQVSDDTINKIINAGEQATWQKIEMIRNCTRISSTLDDIVRRRTNSRG